MSEFCTKCSDDMGFPHADINVLEIGSGLEPGTYVSVICEGCGLCAIAKTKDGKIQVAFLDCVGGEENTPIWFDYEE